MATAAYFTCSFSNKSLQRISKRLGEASKYGSAAIADPELLLVYVQMALERGYNPKRPFDIAVSDYYHNGNDLLWKKHKGDQPKPKNWDMDFYPWYFVQHKRRRKRKSS